MKEYNARKIMRQELEFNTQFSRLEGEFFQVISLHLPWLVDQLASKRHFQISNPSGQRGRGRQGDYVGWFVRL